VENKKHAKTVTEDVAEIQVDNTEESVDEGSLCIVDDIMGYTPYRSDDGSYGVAKEGMMMLLQELYSSEDHDDLKIDGRIIDRLVEEIDNRLSAQLDEILHHPDFKKAESTWNGLKFLVNKVDFDENVRIELFNASKHDLADDFDDSGGALQSLLYKKVYTEEYGQFGGEPYGLIMGAYEFTHQAHDVKLLENLSKISAVSNAPFISSASSEFFSVKDYEDLSEIKDVKSLFDAPQYATWNGFRDSDDSRNVGLAMPKFMLRTPYGESNPVRSVNYIEKITSKDDYSWGYASYALTSCIANSFAQYRWCPNIIGPNSGGSVHSIPLHVIGEGRTAKTVGPTEVAISDRREYELSEAGFIPFVVRKGSDQATFFSAHSAQRNRTFGNTPEGKQAALDFSLGAQLPFWFIITRISHYLKVLQRESLGSWKNREDVEVELNKWLSQYMADQDNPSPSIRSQRPLRNAHVSVKDIPGEAGWYQVHLQVQPHFKFMGANFTLSLTGMVEKA